MINSPCLTWRIDNVSSPLLIDSVPAIDRYLTGAHRIAWLRRAFTRFRTFPAAAMLITVLAPMAASAECVFTEPATAHGVRDGVPEDSALSNLWPKMATLGGIRPLLARGGIQVSATYIGEVLGNPSGGVKQGTDYDGLLDVHVDANMENMIGWKGLCFHTNMFQILRDQHHRRRSPQHCQRQQHRGLPLDSGWMNSGSSRACSAKSFRSVLVNWPPTLSSCLPTAPALSLPQPSAGPR